MTAAVNEPMAVYKRLWGYTRRYLWMFLLGIASLMIAFRHTLELSRGA